MKFQLLLSALAASVLAQNNSPILTEVLSQNNDTLSSLRDLLNTQPDLVQALAGLTNITILAPSNDAFNNLAEAAKNKVGSDAGFAKALLQYHVLNGSVKAADISDKPTFAHTLLTNQTYANVTNGQVVEAIAQGDTVTFKSAVGASSNVTKADIAFQGGVIHVINNVLTIPKNVSATATAANLTAIAGALTQANLVSAVEGLEDITVFVPNNDAFKAISSIAGNISTEALAKILQYHVVKGTVAYSSTLSNSTVQTLNGNQTARITVQDGSVYVNSAKVVLPDVLIANGVVHVIDSVLNPNNTETAPNPSTTTAAFPGTSSASNTDVPFTSAAGGAGGTTLSTGTSTQGAVPQATAAVMAGALFGGAALVIGGL